MDSGRVGTFRDAGLLGGNNSVSAVGASFHLSPIVAAMKHRLVQLGSRRGTMLATIKDWHQTVSWKAGHADGNQGRLYQCPWWADDGIYALAYVQAEGSRHPFPESPTIRTGPAKDR